MAAEVDYVEAAVVTKPPLSKPGGASVMHPGTNYHGLKCQLLLFSQTRADQEGIPGIAAAAMSGDLDMIISFLFFM